ncbi:hypothetical protein XPA_005911 [Xanthoria parietina]
MQIHVLRLHPADNHDHFISRFQLQQAFNQARQTSGRRTRRKLGMIFNQRRVGDSVLCQQLAICSSDTAPSRSCSVKANARYRDARSLLIRFTSWPEARSADGDTLLIGSLAAFF